ncbi:glycerophosphodiester phosphodiesterase family protein [Streptomyces sp. ACA25]|uniref:glycerophosphodiester phosphodiesterase n=1 Tax=Streptomyces sp. ACA25 TaxID=3022596 RepID=UPI002307766F|nr:glycerophosphodiester phosphodiesterase family protein [Streptomyces sp. ACA25]MDB1089306.1 glycerophosphodiester phosphodiesterase family protein [Streptomyces sp. ACA25]
MPLLTVGHRGLMGVEPENTLRSFLRAERAGVDVVELDLHLSRDGQLVVMHDATVDRTTDGSGRIADLSLPELQKLDAGDGERVPVLEEVVDAVTSPLQTEIKDVAAARVLARLIRRSALRHRVRVISFHDEALREVRALLPDIPLGLVTGNSTASAPERARALGADLVSCALPELTSGVVGRCHAEGIAVISWTVNTHEDLTRARQLRLDGVVTDSPEIVARLRPAA